MTKSYDKHLLFQNIRELSKKLSVKLGDIEKESGLTVGYMSRLDKQSNTTEPSLEFVLTAAKILKTDVDSLLRYNLSGLSPNEQYIMNFLNKLIDYTTKDKLFWNVETAEYLNDLDNQAFPINPLFSMETFETYPGYYTTSISKLVFKSNYYGRGTTVNGNCYNTKLSDDCALYLMKINNIFTQDIDVIEIWLYNSTTVKTKLLTSNVDLNLSSLVYKLYQSIEKNMQHPTIEPDFKSIIDSFMNK